MQATQHVPAANPMHTHGACIPATGAGFDWSKLQKMYAIITPQQARAWLLRNTMNRPLDRKRVVDLVRDILVGRWVYDGTPVTFDCDGVLTNGQHRLQAIVDSETAVVSDVVFGLHPDVRFVQDSGKSRLVHETVALVSKIPQHKAQSAWVGCALRVFLGPRHRATARAVIDRYNANRARFDWLTSMHKTCRRGLDRSPVWMVFALAMDRDENATWKFVERYCTGVSLGARDPEHLLRESIGAVAVYGGGMETRLAERTAQALSLAFEGRTTTKLIASAQALQLFVPSVDQLRAWSGG